MEKAQEKLTITVSNLTYDIANSEETLSYTADIEIDGVTVGKAKNSGRGEQTRISGRHTKERGEALERAHKVIAELPEKRVKIGSGDNAYSYSIERSLDGEIDTVAARMVSADERIEEGWDPKKRTIAVLTNEEVWSFDGQFTDQALNKLIKEELAEVPDPVLVDYKLNDYVGPKLSVTITGEGALVSE